MAPAFIVIDGKRYAWKEILKLRREQRKAAKQRQLTLFALKEDIHTVDRRLQWLNGVALLFIGLVPFSTAFLGRYPLQRPAIIFYGINFLLVMALFYLLFRYASRDHVSAHGKAQSTLGGPNNNLVAIGVYLPAILFAFVSPYVSLALFASMPIYYLGVALIDPS